VKGAIHICRFTACDDTPKPRNYEELKARALAVGRFSVFEASENMTAATRFTRLCRDPEIETFQMGFPWTGVRLRKPTLASGEAG
jgi:hypothetical protein